MRRLRERGGSYRGNAAAVMKKDAAPVTHVSVMDFVAGSPRPWAKCQAGRPSLAAACKTRLRTERKAGRLLAKMDKAQGAAGGNPDGSFGQRRTNTTAGHRPTLRHLGVTKLQSLDARGRSRLRPRPRWR